MKVYLFLHPLLVRLLSLVTILIVSLPFNSYLQGVKITEGLFWIRGGISATAAQEKGMPSPFGASLAAIKCSFYLPKEGGKLKVLSFHKAKKLKKRVKKSCRFIVMLFTFFFPFLFACTENGQLTSETFLGILNLELGIKLGDIWNFQVLPTDFFLWSNLKAGWERSGDWWMVFLLWNAKHWFLSSKTVFASKGRFNNRSN